MTLRQPRFYNHTDHRRGAAPYGDAGRDPPFVLEGNGRVDRLRRTAYGLRFRFTARVPGELVLSHPSSCTITVGDRSADGKRTAGFDPLRSGHDVYRYVLPRDAASGGTVVSIGCRR